MNADKFRPAAPFQVVANSWQITTIYDANQFPVCRLDLEDWGVDEDNQSELEAAQTIVARVLAAAPDLLEALVWHEQFRARDGEGGSSFERVAANFHRDTGYLAPGKDCRIHDPEIRQAAWDKWIADGIARTRAAIAKAGVTE